MPSATLFIGGLLAAVPHLAVAAQRPAQVPTRPLARPEAVFPEPFSMLRGVRELRDGRVLVSDWIEEEVLLLDFRGRSRRVIGQSGRGPREYRLPTRLMPLPADSTLLWDEGNQRLLLIGPDLGIIGPIPRPAEGQANPAPTGADAAGGLYFSTPGWALGLAPGDSIPVSRWDRRTGRVTVIGRIKPSLPRDEVPVPRRTLGIPILGFSPSDAYLPTPDGRVVFVRAGDYSIEVRGRDGRVQRGPAHAYPTRAVNDRDRSWWVRRFMTQTPVGGRGPDGGMGRPPAEWQTAEFIRTMVENHRFADRLPYFAPGAVWLTPGGDLLVQRTAGPDAELILDRFSLDGRLVEHLELPRDRTVLGVGAGTLYLVVTQEDGLQQLERYRY